MVAFFLAFLVASCGSPQPSPRVTGGPPVSTSRFPPGSPSASPTASESPSFGPFPPADTNVTAFFYLWYGTPDHDGAWRHWNQDSHTPPDNIAASFYPVGGPYSSRDPQVLARQMAELRQARIGVISVSWWGQGSWEDQTLDELFAAADAAGVKVAFHLEPYNGQTATSMAADIRYLLGRFGSAPALYRAARPNSGDPSTQPRPVFYVFGSSKFAATDLQAAIAGLRGTADDAIVMVHSPKAASATRVGADGVYTYSALASPDTFDQLVTDCRAANLICAPSVAPGFDNSNAVSSGALFQDRQDGARYDAMWQAAIATSPEWVGVTSFNEWHESSQIEPAVAHSSGGRTYPGYDAAAARWLGAAGSAASAGSEPSYGAPASAGSEPSNAYLDRTAYWISRLTGS